MGQLGPMVLLFAVLNVGLWFNFRNMARGQARLADEGGLLPGELLSAKIRSSKNGNYLRVECRFTSPQGKLITGKKDVGGPARYLKPTPPPSGTKVLVLYDGDRLWQVL